jgi:hypothetical protein
MGSDLMALTNPAALATMATFAGAWIGSHLIGVGELADVILLMRGYTALGRVAITAGEALYHAVCTTVTAHHESDYEAAADLLAKTISLLGVQLVMALLLKNRPGDTFKHPLTFRNGVPCLPAFEVAMKMQLPRNAPLVYKPRLVFTSKRAAGEGGTKSWSGDITVSRRGTHEDRLLAIYHERVHSFLVPKLYLLRNLRCYIARAGYVRSYLLRYFEEALAETIARSRVHGFSRANLLAGIQFPLQARNYQISVIALSEEMRGICFGPINVGGMVYKVYAGAMFNDE